MELDKPINQINLMLALVRDWPRDYEVRPILREWGYALKAVGRGFPLPVALFSLLRDRVALKAAAKPDLVLASERERKILEIECKTQSFDSGIGGASGSNDDGVRQARTLMLLDPKELAKSLGLKEVTTGVLAYVIATASVELQEVTLAEIAAELSGCGQACVEHCVWGLRNAQEGVYLWNLQGTPDEVLIVRTTDPDWEPLRTIPFDPSIDARDEKGAVVFRERIRQEVAHCVLSVGVGHGSISPALLCSRVIPIWDFWDNDCRRSVLTQAKRYVESILAQAAKAGLQWRREHGTYLIEVPGDREADAVTRYLSSPRYWQGDIEVQMSQSGPPMVEDPPEA